MADKRTAQTLRRCQPACCRQTRHDASANAPVTSLRRLRQKHATQMTLARRAHRPLGPARAPINATSDVDSEGRCKANGPDGEQPGENMAGSSIHVGWQLAAPPQASFLAPKTHLSKAREVACPPYLPAPPAPRGGSRGRGCDDRSKTLRVRCRRRAASSMQPQGLPRRFSAQEVAKPEANAPGRHQQSVVGLTSRMSGNGTGLRPCRSAPAANKPRFFRRCRSWKDM